MDNDEFRKYCIDHIRSTLSERDLLEQLAEEAAELSQAALKKIRADKMNNNYTPLDSDTADDNLLEEVCDVILVLKVMGLLSAVSTPKTDFKIIRWAERLDYIGK